MRVRQYEADYLDLILRQLTTFITFYFSFENTIAFKLFAKCKGDNNQSYSYKNWFSHFIWLTYNFNYVTLWRPPVSNLWFFQIFLDLLISSKFGPESDFPSFFLFLLHIPVGDFSVFRATDESVYARACERPLTALRELSTTERKQSWTIWDTDSTRFWQFVSKECKEKHCKCWICDILGKFDL